MTTKETVDSAAGSVIVNPISRERILIRTRAAETGGEALVWELFLDPGGRVPSSHAHPEQEERFTMVSGRMRFRVGRRRITVGPGETVTVPPGTVHGFANAGTEPAHVLVRTTPALDMVALLETAAAIARDQQAAHRAFPRVLDLAQFMCEFDREVRAPYLPRGLVRVVTRTLSRLARRFGTDTRYGGLRADAESRLAG